MKQKIIIRLLIILFIGGFLCFFGWSEYRGFDIKRHGVELYATKIIEPSLTDFTPFKKLSGMNSKKSSLSYCLSFLITKTGIPITPDSVFNSFKNKNALDSLGQPEIKKLNEVFPKFGFIYKSVFDGTNIQNDLINGRLPLLKLKNNNGKFIWVLTVGINKDGFFLVINPQLQGSPFKLTSLRRAYAYRVVYRSE